MITDQQRAAVVAGLLELRAFWPAIPDGEIAVRSLCEDLDGFTPEEIAAAFRTVRSTHEHASAPKPWHVKQAAAQAAKRLRWKAPVVTDGAPDFCSHCHTPDLYETPHGRLQPWHRPGCLLTHPDDDEWLRLAQESGKIWSGGAQPKRGAA
ncbi:MAG TPA: hypothetical protein VF178_10960 [Gemmatimonadaceae bacterium]